VGLIVKFFRGVGDSKPVLKIYFGKLNANLKVISKAGK
jgi:hypothetical protein